ncbi:uncharacterized protein [Henckelia pumila]|uniref:uncharacterized protein n=1 Tax=Henckelia pumila TaxID=405737 RepID=UPI003C6DBB3B
MSYVCSKACEASFLELKKRLTSAPVLTIPLDIQPIRVYVIQVEPELLKRIKEAKKFDQNIQKSVEMLRSENQSEYQISADNVLFMNNRIVVLDVSDLKHNILKVAHSSKLSIHPGGKKMYNDLKMQYLWKQMKADVTEFVYRCLNFQQPDASHILKPNEAELDETLRYFEQPIQILDRKEKQLRNKTI